MQLNRLKIHNIASIEDAEIDFRSGILRDASIFLICGETGSGKSTILDAICLALYGDTPRMASVKKEELELTVESVRDYERYYNNDNSQLLRRGAGEGSATLYFTGNDGKEYEAVWEVHRAHNKPNKRLLTPSRSLRALDDSFAENRKGEIKGKVEEVTGLQFDQFCRTVMLAQGEFTKFLKSGRNEKSEILEKLTGTEIYTRLGAAIAEHYSECQRVFDECKRRVELTKPLEEEKLVSLQTLLTQLADSTVEKTALLKKRQNVLKWLESDKENRKRIESLRKDLSDLEEAGKSESMLTDRRLIVDYMKSATGRHLLLSRRENGKLLTEKERNIIKLRENLEKVEKEEKDLKEIYLKRESEAEAASVEAGKVDNAYLASEIKRISERDLLLSSILTTLQMCEERSRNLDKVKREKGEEEERLNGYIAESEGLKAPIEDKEKSLREFTEKLEEVRLLSSEAAKELRRNLKVGDDCPVCGQRVNALLPDEYFESRLEPLKQVQKSIEKDLLEMKGRSQALANLIKEGSRKVKRLQGDIENNKKDLEECLNKKTDLLEEGGMKPDADNEIKESIERERSELAKTAKEAHTKLKEGEQLRKRADKLLKEVKKLRIDLDKVSDGRNKSVISLESANAEIKTIKESIIRLDSELKVFFTDVAEITPERLEELAGLSQSAVEEKERRIETFDDTMKITQGKLAREMEFSEEHAASRPEMDEEMDIEEVSAGIISLEKEIKEAAEESGRITEQIAQDKEVRRELEKRMAELDKAREERDRWESLYRRLGDQKGSKFRSVAQSYILKSLLDNANLYMKRFSDRYTLTCNPGTLAILVKDSFKPSDPQPATILSGGESFMASLALALALSNLRSGGMAVDILFIDEGFGTLSPEYLGNVMDTLEKLYQIGGRKVGLISHVAEMKERIPVHIEVRRESPAMSVIRIEDTGM